MNARKLLSLFLAIAFALTTFATPVFADNGKHSVKNNNGKSLASYMQKQPANKSSKKANPGKGNSNFKFSDSKEVEWATKAIEKLGIEGILTGKSGNQFKPKENVTELEALSMILNLTGEKADAAKYNNRIHPSYKGVKPTWGLGYLFVAIENKILLPEELKGFNPNAPVKRHEVAKYIVRALDKASDAKDHMDETLDYADASAIPHNSVGYVYVAVEAGLMKVNANNEFQPMKPVTRAEMAVILDNSDGSSYIPDADSKTTRITFVSYDASTNKITVKQNSKTYTYSVIANAPVYIDSKYSTMDALKSGDRVQLVFNASNQIIFVEVTRISDGQDDNGSYSELGYALSVTNVVYDSLPDKIKQNVDSLKSEENYRAYRYDNSLYLVAARGVKNTGGYSINIEKVFRYKTSDSHYVLNVVTHATDPASTAIVTQALTYPYDVVKINYFSGIDKVTFLDLNKEKLADTTVSQVQDQSTVSGVIKSINTSNRTVEIQTGNGSSTKYIISSNTPVSLNDRESSFSNLATNMRITITLVDSSVISVDAHDTLETYTGTLTGINISTEKVITLKIGSSYKSYTVAADTNFYINSAAVQISDLKINSDTTVKLVNGVLAEVSQR